jgi:hypothetical protein
MSAPPNFATPSQPSSQASLGALRNQLAQAQALYTSCTSDADKASARALIVSKATAVYALAKQLSNADLATTFGVAKLTSAQLSQAVSLDAYGVTGAAVPADLALVLARLMGIQTFLNARA